MRIRTGARKALIVSATATMLVVSTGIVNVFAVHDETFQLDGDVRATTPGTPTLANDWDTIFTAVGANQDPLPTGYSAATFKQDFSTTTKKGKTVFATADPTTFATGSKDTLDITPGWQCSPANNLLSKNDIMNAYAAAYTDPDGNQFMYFGLERNSNNGDANVAFWFLQGDADCSSTSGNVAWTGHHSDGDLLIVSAFTNGGGVSTIDAYRWDDADGAGGAPGSLNTTSVAHGKECTSTLGGDPICATTNGSPAPGIDAAITTPWQTSNADDNVGNTLQPSEFFEGGINLTGTGFGGQCFNTFVGDTRSSQSLTATIFDYARGRLGECTSSTSTQAKDSGGAALTTVAIPATGTLTVKDTATVNVTGVNSFSGTVQFYLCGPSTTSISTCAASGTGAGAAIGSAHTVTANGSVDQTATLTSAGYYCWHAVFSGDSDAGVPGSEDSGANECFRVTPLQPILATTATTGPVDFGQPITDTISLTGTANKPGSGTGVNVARGAVATGTIHVDVYGPDSCASTAIVHSANLTVSGDSTTYGGAGSTVQFTPTAPGQYVFVASYDGDSPNTLGVTATACASQPAAEKVTVQQIPTSISTSPSYFPQDSATVASSVGTKNLPDNGTVTFRLYDSLANCQAHGTTLNSGGLKYAEAVSIGSNPGTSKTVGTDNQTFRVSDNSTYYWWVTYVPGGSVFTSRQSNCAESITATLTGAAAPGTLLP